jgi:hypothetical protein
VKAAFHGHHILAAEFAANQPAGVADGRGFREMRDLAVVDRRFDFDFLDEALSPGRSYRRWFSIGPPAMVRWHGATIARPIISPR